jgi:hypothetical protein
MDIQSFSEETQHDAGAELQRALNWLQGANTIKQDFLPLECKSHHVNFSTRLFRTPDEVAHIFH